MSSNVGSALDRLVMGATSTTTAATTTTTTTTTNGGGAPFIPATTWEGSKPGYYFGTSQHGTGYYLDDNNDKTTATRNKRPRVQIAEERNETRVIQSVDELLKQAELKADTNIIVDVTRKGVRSAAISLTKAVQRNELQRAKYCDKPDEYMESEVALYENISALKAFAAAEDLATVYPAIIDTNSSSSNNNNGQQQNANNMFAVLLQLLWHDNTDIVASVVGVFLEWLDSTLLEDDDDEGNLVPAVAKLAAALLRDGTESLVANLARLQQSSNDNENDTDQVGKGVEDVLSLIENLLEMDGMIAASGGNTNTDDNNNDLQLVPGGETVAFKLAKETTLVSWLVQQVSEGKRSKDRCLEMLALFAPREEVHSVLSDWSQLPVYQSAFLEEQESDQKKTKEVDSENGKPPADTVDAIEVILQTIAAYRKKQPEDEQQVESLENACTIMASALAYSSANVKAFLDAQGIELAIRCLKERVHAGGVTLNWLEFSGSEAIHRQACEQLVDAGALKFLFPIFEVRKLPKPAPATVVTKRARKEWQETLEATSIRILYCLTRHLKDDSPNDVRERLLAKFVGDERCDRLVELCLAYDQKARLAEYKFFRSDVEDALQDDRATQLAALDAKLAGGGDIFHRLGAIMACCCIGSKRCHERILSQLHLQQSGIGLVRDSLEEFISVLSESEQKEQLRSYLEQI